MKVVFKSILSDYYKQKGLTLVEVAIVLVILGLLIGLGASLIGPLTKRAKIQEAREIVRQAKEAFIGYAITRGYLPEESTYNTTTPIQAFQDVGTRGYDPWGKPLRYIVADEIKGGSKNICSISSTTLSITDKGTHPSNIAFVIISGGANYNIQTQNTIYEIDTPDIDDFTVDIYRKENYDDIVEYVSLFELISKRCQYSQTNPSQTELCSSGNCTSNCQIIFKNASSDNNIWVKAGTNCIKLSKDDTVTLILNAGSKIYVYNNSACQTPIDTLNLANPVKSPATIQWQGIGLSTCN